MASNDNSTSHSSKDIYRQQVPHKKSAAVPPYDAPDVAMEAYINKLNLHFYNQLDDFDKNEHLRDFDALELFAVVQEVSHELSIVKLENHILTDFLEKNDPKLLVGLRQRRATAQSVTKSQRLTITSNLENRQSIPNIRRSSSRRSITTISASIHTMGSIKRTNIDYRINFKTKTEMAEKACAEVERRIRVIELSATFEIKLLNARLEEIRYRNDETEETVTNFELHFLRDHRDVAFLESSTEKQVERKLRKFVNNWIKCARALLGTMRLRITTLQESCQSHRSNLMRKADLSGILGAVDFEQLKIKRAEYQKSLDDKNTNMAGLKSVTGKASLALIEEKLEMMAIEEKSQNIANKTVDMVRGIAKLEKEAKYVEEENKKSNKTLKNLKETLDHYDAPSVSEYIECKDELVALEKEEKMLNRKIYILGMKFSNVYKKCKRLPDGEEIYN